MEKLGENLKKMVERKVFCHAGGFYFNRCWLTIIGIKMWLVLAIIAGQLNFIPNIGPLLAMIPAVLVALLSDPATAAIVAGMYLLIQMPESNFITPMVQQKLINIPSALIINAQLLISPLKGLWGLVLTTPLIVIMIIMVQELYIKNQGN